MAAFENLLVVPEQPQLDRLQLGSYLSNCIQDLSVWCRPHFRPLFMARSRKVRV